MIANKINRGSTEISKAYLNGQIVYSSDGVPSFTATYQIDDISEPLTLPVNNDYPIDWGDGVTTTTGNQHFYTSTGVKTVNMFGVVDDFSFNNSGDKDKLLTIENGGGFILKQGNCFSGCSNFTEINSSIKVEFLGGAFKDCSNLDFDLKLLDFEGIQSIGLGSCFNGCESLTGDGVEIFDNIKVTTIQAAFAFCTSFNVDISKIDFSETTSLFVIMVGKSSADYNYQYLDALYNKLAFGDPVTGLGGLDFTKLTNLTTNFGTIQYSSAGAAARDSLVAQGLIITDGGDNGL